MCELVVLEGHLPSITACEKEKKTINYDITQTLNAKVLSR